MTKRRPYRELDDVVLSADEAKPFDEIEAVAEAELDALRVNFRWGAQQVDMVKLAAEMVGVPYQTYIKEAAYRQAIADVRSATAAQRIQRVLRLKKALKNQEG